MMRPESIIRTIDDRARRIAAGMRSAIRSAVDAAYSSGDPKTQRPEETAAANITKKVLIVYGVTTMAASDDIVEIPVGDGTVILGKLGSPGGIVNAHTWLGIGWATPANDATLLTANTERNTTSASYVEVKRFALAFPGRYRVTMELARSAGTTQAKLQLMLPDGTWVDASTVASSTTTHPSFSSHTVDMNVSANAGGMILRVVYLNTNGPTQTAYIKNVVVKYGQAGTTPSLHSATLVD